MRALNAFFTALHHFGVFGENIFAKSGNMLQAYGFLFCRNMQPQSSILSCIQ
jgi:hypothetical protein